MNIQEGVRFLEPYQEPKAEWTSVSGSFMRAAQRLHSLVGVTNLGISCSILFRCI